MLIQEVWFIYTYVCMYVCVYLYLHMYIYICIHVYSCIQVQLVSLSETVHCCSVCFIQWCSAVTGIVPSLVPQVWDPMTGQCLHTLHGHTSTVRCMAMSGNTGESCMSRSILWGNFITYLFLQLCMYYVPTYVRTSMLYIHTLVPPTVCGCV